MWTANTLEWIDIELTSFCNIKCKGCFRVESKYADQILNKTYLDFETIKEKFQKQKIHCSYVLEETFYIFDDLPKVLFFPL